MPFNLIGSKLPRRGRFGAARSGWRWTMRSPIWRLFIEELAQWKYDRLSPESKALKPLRSRETNLNTSLLYLGDLSPTQKSNRNHDRWNELLESFLAIHKIKVLDFGLNVWTKCIFGVVKAWPIAPHLEQLAQSDSHFWQVRSVHHVTIILHHHSSVAMAQQKSDPRSASWYWTKWSKRRSHSSTDIAEPGNPHRRSQTSWMLKASQQNAAGFGITAPFGKCWGDRRNGIAKRIHKRG